eukprot:SAG22_NODE_1408_length_4484_cov_9.346180_1_plen_26_part_10
MEFVVEAVVVMDGGVVRLKLDRGWIS